MHSIGQTIKIIRYYCNVSVRRPCVCEMVKWVVA